MGPTMWVQGSLSQTEKTGVCWFNTVMMSVREGLFTPAFCASRTRKVSSRSADCAVHGGDMMESCAIFGTTPASEGGHAS